MLTHVVLLAQLLGFAAPSAPSTESYRPRIEVWTNRGDDPYSSGEPVRVSFKTERDAFVTLLRVDTDGRIHILFPREPWGDNFARGGRVYEVEGAGTSTAFRVDDYPGEGYLFAVASVDPFTYDAIASAQHWDYRLIGDDGQIRGDPYAALTDLASRMVPEDYADWDYDVVPYYVQQHYQYPRFLCYDCHSYVSYPRWNPYDYSCVRFRIVVFDDPYYYPYRYYGGTRVVFTRPFRPEPRFIFRDRGANDAFVTRVRERPVNDDRRRDVGVRGRDLGGPGVVPPPQARPRDGYDWRRPTPAPRPETPDQRDNPGRYDRPTRPDHTDRPAPASQPSQPSQPGRRDRPSAPAAQPEHRQPPRERSAHPDEPAPRTTPSAPRQPPKAEPNHQGSRESGGGQQPELRRRRP